MFFTELQKLVPTCRQTDDTTQDQQAKAKARAMRLLETGSAFADAAVEGNATAA